MRKAAFVRQSFASLLCLNRCILVLIPSIPYVNCRTEQRWKAFTHEFTTTPSAGSLPPCIIHTQGWEVQKQLESNEKITLKYKLISAAELRHASSHNLHALNLYHSLQCLWAHSLETDGGIKPFNWLYAVILSIEQGTLHFKFKHGFYTHSYKTQVSGKQHPL